MREHAYMHAVARREHGHCERKLDVLALVPSSHLLNESDDWFGRDQYRRDELYDTTTASSLPFTNESSPLLFARVPHTASTSLHPFALRKTSYEHVLPHRAACDRVIQDSGAAGHA
jgi:hypothetical protein